MHRVKTAATALALTLMLVIGVDHLTFAATGDSLLLGKNNKTNKATVVKRTSSGPVLNLKAKNGAPLKVNSGTKVKKLHADKLDGFDAATLRARTTTLGFTQSTFTAVGESYEQIKQVGSFTKARAGSTVRIDLATHYQINGGFGGAGALAIQLRVDGQPIDGGVLLLRDGVPLDGPLQLAGLADGLSAGNHTLSVWAKAYDDDAPFQIDAGNYSADGTNYALVTEMP